MIWNIGRKFFFLLISYCHLTIAKGQCVEQSALWGRLVFFRDSSAIAPSQPAQLRELLGYDAAMKNCSYQFDSTHVFLLQRIGILYHKQANYLPAIHYIRRSNNVIQSNSGRPAVNARELVRNYYILHTLFDSLGRTPESMKALDSCILYSIRFNWGNEYALYGLRLKTIYLYDIGDYRRAIESADAGASIVMHRYASGDSIGNIVNFLVWKTNALLALKEFDLAEKALDNKLEEIKRTGAKHYLGIIYELLAESKAGQGHLEKSNLLFQVALQHDISSRDYLGCKQTLNNWGYILHFKKIRDYNKTIATYRKALQYLQKYEISNPKEPFESLNLYGNIGYVYLHQSRFDSAFSYFQLAFDQIRPGMTERDILKGSMDTIHYKRIRSLVSLLIEKGEAYNKRFRQTKNGRDIEEAITLYRLTDQLLDKIRSRQSEIQSKLFWRNNTRKLYEQAIEACYLAGKPHEAFYFFEKSRAVLLLDQLNEQRLLKPDDLIRLSQLKRTIRHLEREYDNNIVTDDRRTEIARELFSIKQDLDNLSGVIATNNPLYDQGIVDSASVTMEAARKTILTGNKSLVELFAGDSAVYTLFLTAGESRLRRIDKTEFDSLVNIYIRYISNPSSQNSNFPAFVDISSRLYHLLFPDEALSPGRIIISPDGYYFPFEALVIQKNPVTYFINDYAVSYTYSARYLMNHFAGAGSSSSNDFMGVAPVLYPAGMHLASLQGSDHSIRELLSDFRNADILTATDATRDNFLTRYYKYKVIQLYTHSSASSEHNEPVIYFADSALYLSDLSNEVKPATRLIVLSACETGLGKLYQGEGVFSFNRGFAALGIPAAIANLWAVDNVSTYRLTELFYKWLAKGLPTDVALQKAKLEFLHDASREKSMPCYWAGPVLVGKTDIIALKRPYPWKRIILFLVAGGIVLFAVRQRLISKTTT